MTRFMVPVNCFQNAVDALSRSGLKAGPPLPRSACVGNMSVSYPVFVDAESRWAAKRRVRSVLPDDGYEVAEPRSLRTTHRPS